MGRRIGVAVRSNHGHRVNLKDAVTVNQDARLTISWVVTVEICSGVHFFG